MRILIISKYFPPENSIASLRPHSWAKYWSRLGHEVEVLTTSKGGPKPEDLDSDLPQITVHEIDFHPFYYRLKDFYKKFIKKAGPNNARSSFLPKPEVATDLKRKTSVLAKIKSFRSEKGLFMAQRMPDSMDLWIQPATDWVMQSGSWDLVVSTFAPYSCHLIAYKMRQKGLARHWIADFRDLWTDHHIYKGLFPFSLLEKYLERKIILSADFITTVSQPLADTILQNFKEAKVKVIENGFDSDELKDLPSESYFQDDKIRLIQTGTVYKGKQDPQMLFNALADIAADSKLAGLLADLEVLFVGANSEEVVEKAKEMGLGSWVKSGGFLPRKDILRMQRDAHGLIFLGFDKGRTPGILTGKLFEYLFSGTPIWALEIDEQSSPGQLITQSNAGILFNEDQEKLRLCLLELLQNPVKQEAKTNRVFLQNYERKHLAYKMLRMLDNFADR